LLDREGVPCAVLDANRNPDLWSEIARRTGRDTVPQIFIGDWHSGVATTCSRWSGAANWSRCCGLSIARRPAPVRRRGAR